MSTPVAQAPYVLGGVHAAPPVQTGWTQPPTPPSGGPPSGGAGGVLSGQYPNPGFAVNMATQAELDAQADRIDDLEAESARSFTHVQTVGQSVITLAHSLGFRPQVSLFSTDYGTKYRAFGVQHLDVNTLRISMDVPTPCVAVLS